MTPGRDTTLLYFIRTTNIHYITQKLKMKLEDTSHLYNLNISNSELEWPLVHRFIFDTAPK